MRILLLNPPAENTVIEYPDEAGDSYLESSDFGRFPPLGLLYLIAYLERHATGHEIFLRDCVAEGITHEALPAVVDRIRPDLVGITSFTIALVDVCMAGRTVRRVAPHAHICLGGHHPIAFPFEAAQLKEFDSVVVGEGEVAFTELVQALDQGRDIEAIPGVYTARSIERFRTTTLHDSRFLTDLMPTAAHIDDVDSVPFPARSYVSHIDFHSIIGASGRLATMIGSRGCPCQCTFCDVPYKRYRQRAVPSIVDEIDTCLREGYQEVHFYDDVFAIKPDRVVEFCDEVERRGLEFPWDFRGRVDALTQESLARAKHAGLRMITFGVETGTDEGLEAIKKGTTTAQARQVFRWCRGLGIKTVADFMLGFPFERTLDDVKRNVDFLFSLDPDYAQFGILTLYPNTELFNRAAGNGLANRQRWVDFVLDPQPGFTVDHWTEHLSLAELVKMQRRAYRRFYLRPRYMARSLIRTRSWYEFKAKAAGVLKLLGIH